MLKGVQAPSLELDLSGPVFQLRPPFASSIFTSQFITDFETRFHEVKAQAETG